MSPAPPPTAPHDPKLKPALRRIVLRAAARCYPGPRPSTSALRSLLLMRPDHLGDLLFLTPALHALRAALPATRITVLVGPWGAPVLQGNPDVDVLETCPYPGFERQAKGGPLAPYRLLLHQARALRSRRYDAAVILRFDHWWGAWLAAAAGVPRRIGYDRPETRPFLTEALPYSPGAHEVEQNARLLAALVPGDAWHLGPTRFSCSEEDRSWAGAWLQDRGLDPTKPLVGIHPGAGAPVKQWPVAAWAAVADGLSEAHGAAILLTGTAGERPLTGAVAAAMSRPVLDAAGETTLGRLAALQERCAVVLGSDSGPLHLAVAVGTPTVHLYGPVAPATFGPWGDPGRHVVLVTDWACAPCNRLDWSPEVLPQHGCMGAIAPEHVLRAAARLLQQEDDDK